MRKSFVLLAILALVLSAIVPVCAGRGPATGVSIGIPGGFDPIVGKYYNVAWAEALVMPCDVRTAFVPGEHQATYAVIVDKGGNQWQELSILQGTKRFERVFKVWSSSMETLGFLTVNIDVPNEAGYTWNITIRRPDGRIVNQHTVYPDDGYFGGRYAVTLPVIKGTIADAYTIVASAVLSPKSRR